MILGNPSDVGHAMMLVDSADSAIWFSGFGSCCYVISLSILSTFARTTVDNVAKVVIMILWCSVLLLLLTGKVSVASVTCVASKGT